MKVLHRTPAIDLDLINTPILDQRQSCTLAVYWSISMFGIDLFSVAIGCALGATFPMFFKMAWNGFKQTSVYKTVAGWFGK
jgi:ABC-type anion transport system duplicated permease subunit